MQRSGIRKVWCGKCSNVLAEEIDWWIRRGNVSFEPTVLEKATACRSCNRLVGAGTPACVLTFMPAGFAARADHEEQHRGKRHPGREVR